MNSVKSSQGKYGFFVRMKFVNRMKNFQVGFRLFGCKFKLIYLKFSLK
jgi:hypothetical protein